MTLRRALLIVASIALGAVLIVLVIRVGKVNLRTALQQLRDVSTIVFMKLVLLTGLHVFLSNVKWRTIDAAVRHESDSVPSRTTSFFLTSAGVAFGQIFPVQLSMSATRTLGTYVYGSALKRGAAGTLFEQSFDLTIVAFLAVASGITRLLRGGATMWPLSAAAMTAVALLVAGPAMSLIRRVMVPFNATTDAPQNHILRRFTELQHSGFLDSRLARRLMLLSAGRFAVQVLMLGQCADAIDAHIPLWQLAAALPFAVIAAGIAMTPGGIGATELSFATVLSLFGTSLTTGARWAVASRLLVTASCLVVAIGAAILLVLVRSVTHIANGAIQEH